MTIVVTLRLKEIGVYYNEAELVQAILERDRACVAFYEDGKFKLYGHIPDHIETVPIRYIHYEFDTLIETDNLRLAVYTLYRPYTAILVERNQPISVVRYAPASASE